METLYHGLVALTPVRRYPARMQANFVKSATKLDELPRDEKPQVALVGRSNVGKSTLLNCLTNQRKLARVSADPGRTQTINLFDVDGKFYLVDLPGYGYAKTSKLKRGDMSEMIRDYVWQSPHLKLVLVILDARTGPTDIDLEMLSFLRQGQIPLAVIVNKMDKLSQSESVKLMRRLDTEFPRLDYIRHSSISGRGRNEIWVAIDKAVRGER
jgi:GTP-binding protein